MKNPYSSEQIQTIKETKLMLTEFSAIQKLYFDNLMAKLGNPDLGTKQEIYEFLYSDNNCKVN